MLDAEEAEHQYDKGYSAGLMRAARRLSAKAAALIRRAKGFEESADRAERNGWAQPFADADRGAAEECRDVAAELKGYAASFRKEAKGGPR